MQVDVILGLQWGDEGKGKIVDFLAPQYDIVARFQGGPNAGHTLKFDGNKYVLHTIPSGIFRSSIINLIGNGVVIDPITFSKEIDNLNEAGVDFKDRLLIANKAHLILPTHRYLDAASERAKGKEKIGSTLKGIGPTYMDKTGRNGIRVGDLFLDDFEKRYEALKAKHLNLAKLYPAIDFDLEKEEEQWLNSIEVIKSFPHVDGEYFINHALKNGKKVLAEGAQGSMLDIDFGTYPYVTSSNTITAGVCTGLGVSPSYIGEVIGITKAYCTRVGSGPFPTELHDEVGEQLRVDGQEFGATTGRPRRCGWLDLPQLQYTIMLNGVTQLVVTKIDVLNQFDTIKVATSYQIGQNTPTDRVPYDLSGVTISPNYIDFKGWKQDLDQINNFQSLPEAAKEYASEVSARLGVPISLISIGPGRNQLIANGFEAMIN